MDTPNDWIGTGKAAERIGAHRDTVRRWVDEGLVPAWRTPKGHRRVSAAAVDELARTLIAAAPA